MLEELTIVWSGREDLTGLVFPVYAFVFEEILQASVKFRGEGNSTRPRERLHVGVL